MLNCRRHLPACGIAVAAILLVAACGSSTQSSSSGSASGSTATSNPTGSAIVLGNVGSYTGPYAAATVPALKALMAWQSWTNAHGGLSGHPVKVLSMDDAADPSQSLTDVKTLVEQDHVLAFVDNELPATVQASESYLAQMQIPTIGGDLSSEDWFKQPMLFPQGTDELSAFVANLAEAHRLGLSRFGDLYCIESPQCQTLSKILGQKAPGYGGTQVYAGSYSIANPSFTAQCLQAAHSHAQAVLLLGAYPSLKAAAAACDEQGFHPIWFAGAAGTDASMVSYPSFEGFTGIQGVFPWVDTYTQAQRDFQAAMKHYAPNDSLGGYSALGWAGAEVLTAASRSLSSNPTSAEILAGLWSLKHTTLDGLTPPLTYVAHSATSTISCYYVMRIKSTHFVDPYGGQAQCLP